MMNIICMLMPLAVVCGLKKRYYKNYDSNTELVFEYLTYTFIANMLSIAVLTFVLKDNTGVMNNIMSYNEFAFKYGVLVLMIGVGVAVIQLLIEEKRVSLYLNLPVTNLKNKKLKKVIIFIFFLTLLMLLCIRLPDNYFWGDEVFSIILAKQGFFELIQSTAADVHPPLYYIILRIVYLILGDYAYVYHLVSIIPVILIIVLSMTLVSKRFGKAVGVLLSTSCVILPASVIYSVEARMYSWGAFFTILSFILLYDILCENRWKSNVFFMVSSLCAAYTHYYVLITVAFMYLLLIVYSVYKKDMKKIITISVITALAYLPWLFVLIQAFGRTADSWWLGSIPTIGECIVFLFGGKRFFYFAFIIAVTYIIKKYNIFNIRVNDGTNKVINIGRIKLITNHQELIWLLGGVLSIIGTIGVGLALSYTIRPFFVTRYLFQLVPVVWLMVGVCISKLKHQKCIIVLLVAYMFYSFMPNYVTTYFIEKEYEEELNDMIDSLGMVENDLIVTDVYHLYWVVGEYYFPETECIYINTSSENQESVDTVVEGDTYLFVYSSTEYTTVQWLEDESNGEWSQLYDDITIGDKIVDIYIWE